ncbi:hypothetical protein [Pedobacter panaciterrae]
MTLSKAKKHIASNYGYNNWIEAISDQESEVCEMMQYEATVLVQLHRIDTGRLDYLYSINIGRAIIIGLAIALLIITLSVKTVQIAREPSVSELATDQGNRRSVGYR